MNMPGPSEGHRKLERLAGTWVGEETMHPSAWDPEGGLATGRTESRIGLAGFVLISDYKQERAGSVTYAGHGVYAYDPETALYSLHWFDSMGSPPERFTGGFEGDLLALAHGGPGMHARLTYDLSNAGTLRSKMEMSQDGDGWKTLFEAVYERRQGGS